MSLTADQVRRIAELARIALSPEEVARTREQLNAILALIEEMQAVDTTAVEPMTHVRDLAQRLREDRVTETDSHVDFQRIAPETEAGLYLVPKVIE